MQASTDVLDLQQQQQSKQFTFVCLLRKDDKEDTTQESVKLRDSLSGNTHTHTHSS